MYLKYISITDHDSISAYNEELLEYAKSNEINIITGVEISTKYQDRGIHVLGYNIDTDNPELLSCLSSLQNARINYFWKVSKELQKLGYHVNTEKLKTLPTITKAHIALDIIKDSKNETILMKNFSHIPSKGEFIEAIMNEGCPAYVEKFSISPAKAREIIKKANGKAILAHPIAYMHEDNLTIDQISNLIQEMTPDGIEAIYLYVDKNNQVYDEINFWYDYAINKNLIVTMGSDFHSLEKKYPYIGFKNYKPPIDEEIINDLIKKLIE